MKKSFYLCLGLLTLAGLPGCRGSKQPVAVQYPEEEVYEAKQIAQQPIKQPARKSGPFQKEVGIEWDDEDYT